jgi:sugar lactone lactonase YvrE
MTGLVFGESARWHDDRLWLADWGAHEIVAVDLDGQREVIVRLRLPSFQAICFDWLRDGRLLIVSSREALLLRREP